MNGCQTQLTAAGSISHPIVMSCDDCFKTFPHTGTPRGRTETIADVETYVSDPPTGAAATGGPNKILLFFSDVFSPFYINSQLIQDWFASNGEYDLLALVYGPQWVFTRFRL